MMILAGILLAICFGLFSTWAAIMLADRSSRKAKLKDEKFKAQHEAWLLEERTRPRWALKIRLATGEEIISAGIPATVQIYKSIERAARITSKERAESHAHKIVAGDSICKVDGRHFPHSQIREIHVVPETSAKAEKEIPDDAIFN